MRLRLLTLPALAALALAGCGGSDDGGATAGTTGTQAAAATPGNACSATVNPPKDPSAPRTKPKVSVTPGPAPSDLVVKDVIPGSGQGAKAGDTLTVQYVGVLCKDSKQFDASWDRGQAFSFPLGGGQVIQGWDRGLVGMKPGGRRLLIIPPSLGYGSQKAGSIPPSSTLVFVVDLERIS